MATGGSIDPNKTVHGLKDDLIAWGKNKIGNKIYYGYATDTQEQGVLQDGTWSWNTSGLTTAQVITLINANSMSTGTVQLIFATSDVPVIKYETGTYGVQAGDDIIRCLGTFAVTLPAATGSKSIYAIKNISSGTITVGTTSSQPIDADLTKTLGAFESILVLDAVTGKWDMM